MFLPFLYFEKYKFLKEVQLTKIYLISRVACVFFNLGSPKVFSFKSQQAVVLQGV